MKDGSPGFFRVLYSTSQGTKIPQILCLLGWASSVTWTNEGRGFAHCSWQFSQVFIFFKRKFIVTLDFLGKSKYSQGSVLVHSSNTPISFGFSAFANPAFRLFSNHHYLNRWFICIPMATHRFIWDPLRSNYIEISFIKAQQGISKYKRE